MSKAQTYFDVARHIKPSDLPDGIKQLFEYVKDATDDHTTWEYCERDPDIKSAVEGAIARILKFLTTVEGATEKPAKARKKATPTPRKPMESKKPAKESPEPQERTGHLAKERGKFVVINLATRKKWADEHFKTEEHARAFCARNNITLIDPPAKAVQNLVPSIGVGLALVKRIHNMVGKDRTVAHLVNLLAAIQKAQRKGQLDKKGDGREAYALLKIWEKKFVDGMNSVLADKPQNHPIKLTVEEPSELLALEAVALGTKQNPLVALILRFLGMQGKPVAVEGANRLIAAIKKQTDSGGFGKGSPQFTAVKSALDSLEDYVGGKRKTPKVSKETLNGLLGIIAACKCGKCSPLNGLEQSGKDSRPSSWIAAPATPPTAATPAANQNAASQAAAQVAAHQDSISKGNDPNAQQPADQSPAPAKAQSPSGFIIAPPVYKGKSNPITYPSHRPPTTHVPTYNFKGRWQQLFNQPTKGFSALVYGQPKSGKSTMAIDFAGYLARHFGRVLYASIEEGGRGTLDERIRRLGVGHPNMDISNNLPADPSAYDFIITDSVSRGNLDLGQMQQLKADWPDKNFIFLFHTTKDGLPRGTNQFLHEVDVLVNVKEGVATADGRFGPGSMDVRFN